MTATEFKEWQKQLELSNIEAAKMLEVTTRAIVNYRKKGGSKMLELACKQLEGEFDYVSGLWRGN